MGCFAPNRKFACSPSAQVFCFIKLKFVDQFSNIVKLNDSNVLHPNELAKENIKSYRSRRRQASNLDRIGTDHDRAKQLKMKYLKDNKEYMVTLVSKRNGKVIEPDPDVKVIEPDPDVKYYELQSNNDNPGKGYTVTSIQDEVYGPMAVYNCHCNMWKKNGVNYGKRNLQTILKSVKLQQVPCIIAGDFNQSFKSLKSVFNKMSITEFKISDSPTLITPHSEKRVDFIISTPGSVQNQIVKNSSFTSDHNIVIAEWI